MAGIKVALVTNFGEVSNSQAFGLTAVRHLGALWVEKEFDMCTICWNCDDRGG